MNEQLEAALKNVREQIAKLQGVEASIVQVLQPKRRGRPRKDPLAGLYAERRDGKAGTEKK